jgi:hypothetical protein
MKMKKPNHDLKAYYCFLSRSYDDGCFCGTHPKGKISGLIPMAYQLILASTSRFSVIKQFVAKRYRTT